MIFSVARSRNKKADVTGALLITGDRWAMAKVAADGEMDIALLTNVDKGGISPSQPHPITPQQQPILDFMREALQPAGAPAAEDRRVAS